METKIIDVEEKMRFWIYDAQRTKEFRKKCRQNKISISEIMKELDDDHIVIKEVACVRKYPRVGAEYQVVRL
jgi:hypothetical protein